MTDSIETFRWEQLARRQKIYIGAAVVLVVIVIGSLAWDSLKLRGEIRGFENQAITAEREKQDALAKAADVAADIKVREEELSKVEVKRDAKKQDVEKARTDVARDRAEYDRAVRTRSADAPSTDELCRQLASVGHPCQPR